MFFKVVLGLNYASYVHEANVIFVPMKKYESTLYKNVTKTNDKKHGQLIIALFSIFRYGVKISAIEAIFIVVSTQSRIPY